MKSIKTILLTMLIGLGASAGYASQMTPTAGAAGSAGAGTTASEADEKEIKALRAAHGKPFLDTAKPGMCLTSFDQRFVAPDDYRRITYELAQKINKLFNELGYYNVLFDYPEYI